MSGVWGFGRGIVAEARSSVSGRVRYIVLGFRE